MFPSLSSLRVYGDCHSSPAAHWLKISSLVWSCPLSHQFFESQNTSQNDADMHKSADHVCSTSVHWTFSFTMFSSTLNLISFTGVTAFTFTFPLSLSLSPSLFDKPKRLQAMSFSPEYLQLGHRTVTKPPKLCHLLCYAVKQCKAKV